MFATMNGIVVYSAILDSQSQESWSNDRTKSNRVVARTTVEPVAIGDPRTAWPGVKRAAAHHPINRRWRVQLLTSVIGLIGIAILRLEEIQAPQANGPLPDITDHVCNA